MKRIYLIQHNDGMVGNKMVNADYLEFRKGCALLWESNPPPDGKKLIAIFSLKDFHVIDKTDEE